MFIEATLHRVEPVNAIEEERGFLGEFAIEDQAALNDLLADPASSALGGYVKEAKIVGDSLWLKVFDGDGRVIQIVGGA